MHCCRMALFGLPSQDLSLTRSSASRHLAPGDEILRIMSVYVLHEAMFAIAGALHEEGQSGSTCLVVLWALRRGWPGLSEVITSGLPSP